MSLKPQTSIPKATATSAASKFHSVIPNTRLPVVVHSDRPESNPCHIIGDKTVITNRLPIFDSGGYQIGAVAVLRDNAGMIALADSGFDKSRKRSGAKKLTRPQGLLLAKTSRDVRSFLRNL